MRNETGLDRGCFDKPEQSLPWPLVQNPSSARQVYQYGDQSSVTEQLDLNRSSLHDRTGDLGNVSHPYIESRNVYNDGGWNPRTMDFSKQQKKQTGRSDEDVYAARATVQKREATEEQRANLIQHDLGDQDQEITQSFDKSAR